MTKQEEHDPQLEFNADFTFIDDDSVEKLQKDAVEDEKIQVASKYDELEEKIKKLRTTTKVVFKDELLESKKRKDIISIDKVGVKDLAADKDFFDDSVAQVEMTSTFADMNLSRPLLKGLAALNFSTPTPIQQSAIPVALMGKDICGGAVTGSGKTAAFLVPIIERLLHKSKNSTSTTRVLILLPTRELAVQCYQVAQKLTEFAISIKVCLAAGGLPMRAQEIELRKYPDIVIATPGRLIDHMRNSAGFTLDSIEILVLDEADRMLEDGFADELNEIIRACPKQRQTILFSASMTDNIDELVRLSLKRPARIFVDTNTTLAKKLQQEFIRVRAEREADRLPILLSLCRRTCTSRCIIFFPTKDLAHHFRLVLGLAGMKVAELHGGLCQADRLDSLERFKNEKVDFLTATDVAARGLDISGVKFVLNYSMPTEYKLYLHRVGRTARAGLAGSSITLVGEGADRKILKMVIKNATETVKHRQIQPAVIDQYRQITEEIQPALEKLLNEEKELKYLQKAEKELQRVENLVNHKDEISSRPKKTWFQSQKQKFMSKELDRKRASSASSETFNPHHPSNQSNITRAATNADSSKFSKKSKQGTGNKKSVNTNSSSHRPNKKFRAEK